MADSAPQRETRLGTEQTHLRTNRRASGGRRRQQIQYKVRPADAWGAGSECSTMVRGDVPSYEVGVWTPAWHNRGRGQHPNTHESKPRGRAWLELRANARAGPGGDLGAYDTS